VPMSETRDSPLARAIAIKCVEGFLRLLAKLLTKSQLGQKLMVKTWLITRPLLVSPAKDFLPE
jgi:hypothetical protein